MNNCIERKNTTVYNEDIGEKAVTFFCFVIAFFENSAVDAVCRMLGAAAVAVSIFFYVSAVMAGSMGIVSAVVFAAAIIAASAFIFRPRSARS